MKYAAIECRFRGPVARLPALTWQPVCAPPVVGWSLCQALSMKLIGPLSKELWCVLAVYIMCPCDIAFDHRCNVSITIQEKYKFIGLCVFEICVIPCIWSYRTLYNPRVNFLDSAKVYSVTGQLGSLATGPRNLGGALNSTYSLISK